MAWLTVCSVCRSRIHFLFHVLQYQRIFNQIDMTSATSVARTAFPSGAHGFFVGVVLFWGVFCRPFVVFVLYLLSIVLCVFRLTASDYIPFI